MKQSLRQPDQLKTKIAPAIRKSTAVNQIDSPEQFERKYVHEVYEQIAPHFSDTRSIPWPLINNFIQSLPPGSRLLDCGCGNGKYLKQAQHLNAVGLDYSANLATIAQQHADVVNGDGMFLPFLDNVFDSVISIAVIHHLVTEERRLQCLKEIFRVMQYGAKALICVWAKEQEGVTGQDLFIPWSQQQQNEKHFNQQQKQIAGNSQEMQVNQQKCVIHQRFYHMFEFGELSRLCMAAGLIVESSVGLELYNTVYDQQQQQDEYYDHDNWYVLVSKPL